MNTPQYKVKQVLVSSRSGEEKQDQEQRYLAFPTLLKLSDSAVLIAYKNGTQHYKEPDASLDIILYNPTIKQIVTRQTIDSTPGVINQNPELVRMPDGAIYMYVDLQGGGGKQRLGLKVYKSLDDGKTFTDEGNFPQIGAYVYGYSFDDAPEQNGTIAMLVMSFTELVGGIRAVHAIRSVDQGRNWTYERNLNDEFAFDFNESSLLPFEDGYIILARGYDQTTKLFRTDASFNLISQKELSKDYPSIDYIGRPKMFNEDGVYYFICRNIVSGRRTGDLQLYRFNPRNLELESTVQLDTNASSAGDSYYAEYYLQEEGSRVFFNVITYVPETPEDKPDIIRLEYDWNELKQLLE